MSDDAEIQASSSPNASIPGMTTGKGILLYLGSFGILIVLFYLAMKFDSFSGGIVFFGYFALGFFLNRIVLRGLIEWHPVYNTLDNVASGKLRMMLLWPVTYPALFFQLLVSQHL
jgi:hypothetical protein